MAGNAIEQFFIQRQEEERLRLEDQFRRQQAAEMAQRQQAQLELQQQRTPATADCLTAAAGVACRPGPAAAT